MNKSEIVKTLIDARRLLADGWCQGTLFRNNGIFGTLGWGTKKQYCALGALCAAFGIQMSLSRSEAPLRSVLAILCELLPPDYKPFYPDVLACNVTAWNDVPKRKQSEVLQLFDQAIVKAIAIVEDEPEPQIHLLDGERVVDRIVVHPRSIEDFSAVLVAE